MLQRPCNTGDCGVVGCTAVAHCSAGATQLKEPTPCNCHCFRTANSLLLSLRYTRYSSNLSVKSGYNSLCASGQRAYCTLISHHLAQSSFSGDLTDFNFPNRKPSISCSPSTSLLCCSATVRYNNMSRLLY